jgi:sec-independent protein translocase protein TatA
MDFFGIGISEILLILIIAVIIVGPRKIVEVGRYLGRITRALKKATSDLTSQVTKELENTEDNPSKAK